MLFRFFYVCYRFFYVCYGDHPDLHVLNHSFPTRRSSDLYRYADHLGLQDAQRPGIGHDQQNRRVGAARFGIAAPEQKIGVRREIEEQATVDTIRARAIAVYSADVLNKRSLITVESAETRGDPRRDRRVDDTAHRIFLVGRGHT